MASVPGSKLAFFSPTGTVVATLTTNGAGIGAPVAGAFNIEVFTAAAGTLAAGYDAAIFAPGATKLTDNQIQTTSSTEMLIAGNFMVIDSTGSELIQLVGSGSDTVMGSAGDTITGSAVAGSSQLIDLSGTNGAGTVNAVQPGPMTAVGGAGDTVVWAGTGDSITGGTGPMLIAGNSANGMKITGGAGDLGVFALGTGNSVTGSTSGFTFVGDGYPGGGGNTIGGGASTVPGTIFGFSFPAGTVIIGGNNDVINGAAGTMLINSLVTSGDSITGGAGAATVWGGTGTTVTGGTGALQYNLGINSSVTGGAGKVNAFALGSGNTITGGSSGGDFFDDSYAGGGNNRLVGGTAATRIIGGGGDTIVAGTGALQAEIKTGFGSETVNLLTPGRAGDGVREVASVPGGTAATVTGFNTAIDVIESATNVSGGALSGGATSTVVAGNTLITFTDGNTMTIVGVTSGIKFSN